MSQYEKMIIRERKWMLYFLAILVLGAGFTPYVRTFLGLLLGSLASFYNLFLLQKKLSDFTEAVAKQERPSGLGTLSRFAAVALAVLIALRFEEYFHIYAVVIGLMTSYLVIMIDFIFFTGRKT